LQGGSSKPKRCRDYAGPITAWRRERPWIPHPEI